MKTTIYELLGMIKDGKAPKKIKYEDTILQYDKYCQDYKIYKDGYLFTGLFEREDCKFLNDEVEIVEEKKIPEKLDDEYSNNANGLKVVWSSSQQHTLKNKINEIIDYLESKEKGE